jgi:hypothetical protein
VNGAPDGDVELATTATSEEILNALELVGALDDSVAEEFDIDEYSTQDGDDGPPAYLVLDQLGEELCLLYPAHLEPEFSDAPPDDENDDGDDSGDNLQTRIIDAEFKEVD